MSCVFAKRSVPAFSSESSIFRDRQEMMSWLSLFPSLPACISLVSPSYFERLHFFSKRGHLFFYFLSKSRVKAPTHRQKQRSFGSKTNDLRTVLLISFETSYTSSPCELMGSNSDVLIRICLKTVSVATLFYTVGAPKYFYIQKNDVYHHVLMRISS